MTHEINERDLNEWLCRPQWQIYASSGEQGFHKRLEIDSTESGPVFRVIRNGETVFLGADKTTAIATYNDAPENRDNQTLMRER